MLPLVADGAKGNEGAKGERRRQQGAKGTSRYVQGIKGEVGTTKVTKATKGEDGARVLMKLPLTGGFVGTLR